MIHIIHTPSAALARRRIRGICQCSVGVIVVGVGVAAMASQSIILKAEPFGCNFTGVPFYTPKQENQQRNAELPPTTRPLNQVTLPMLPMALPEALDSIGEFTLLTAPEADAEQQLETNAEALRQTDRQSPRKIADLSTDSSYTPPEYLNCPEPPYPPQLRQRRVSGCVEVLISISADGLPTEVEILQSSGNQQLDRHTRNWVLKHWTFHPACRSSKTIAAQIRTHIRFSLRP